MFCASTEQDSFSNEKGTVLLKVLHYTLFVDFPIKSHKIKVTGTALYRLLCTTYFVASYFSERTKFKYDEIYYVRESVVSHSYCYPLISFFKIKFFTPNKKS